MRDGKRGEGRKGGGKRRGKGEEDRVRGGGGIRDGGLGKMKRTCRTTEKEEEEGKRGNKRRERKEV